MLESEFSHRSRSVKERFIERFHTPFVLLLSLTLWRVMMWGRGMPPPFVAGLRSRQKFKQVLAGLKLDSSFL